MNDSQVIFKLSYTGGTDNVSNARCIECVSLPFDPITNDNVPPRHEDEHDKRDKPMVLIVKQEDNGEGPSASVDLILNELVEDDEE